MTMITFQKSKQHFSRFPVLYPFSEHSGIIQYHATKFEDKKQSLSVLFSTMHCPLKVGFGGLAHAKLVCLRRCMSCQLTRHVTLSRDPSPAHHLQISNKSKNMDSSYEITQYVGGYLVPKIGKVISYISFLVRDPGFILYCVSLRIWRRLYTVTLSHRIAPEIRTKTHKI